MTELLNCPFCGGKAVAENYAIEAGVFCTGCRAKIIRSHGARDDNGYPEAIAAWNHRHSGGDGEAYHEVLCEICGRPTMHLGPRCFTCTKAEKNAARAGERGSPPDHTPDCRIHDDASVCDCGVLATPRA